MISDPDQIALHPPVIQSFQSIAQWAAMALAAMAGVFGLIMRWFMDQLTKRDQTNSEALKSLAESDKTNRIAVEQFREAVHLWQQFEVEERETHKRLLASHDATVNALRDLAEKVEHR